MPQKGLCSKRKPTLGRENQRQWASVLTGSHCFHKHIASWGAQPQELLESYTATDPELVPSHADGPGQNSQSSRRLQSQSPAMTSGWARADQPDISKAPSGCGGRVSSVYA